MSPSSKARTTDLPTATARVVSAHADVVSLRKAVAEAKETRRIAIEAALAAGATYRGLGKEMGVSGQAVQAMTK